MSNKLKELEVKLNVTHSRFVAMCAAVLMFIPLLALDLITKIVFEKVLTEKGPIIVIENFFHFELVYNRGCFAGWGENSFFAHILLILFSIAGAVIIVWLFIKKFRVWNNWIIIGLGLMLPGDVGNLVDRVIYQDGAWRGVIDFFYFNLGFMEWPTFNVADMLLVVGIIVLVIGFFIQDSKEDKEKEKKQKEILESLDKVDEEGKENK